MTIPILQTIRPADPQTFRLADPQTFRLADPQTFRLADLQTSEPDPEPYSVSK
jgi:hypothetical protein